MENTVLSDSSSAESLAERSASRAVSHRYATYLTEVRQLIDAGYRVMQRAEGVDPRVGEIVREAGLSNQAFYRHFRSKDELLIAILDDGLRKLVDYLEHRMKKSKTPLDRVRAWIEGVLAQASNRKAARATRPFALGGMRLQDRFPVEARASIEHLKQPLVRAIDDARTRGDAPGADAMRDAEAIYQLAMGCMQRHLVERVAPSARDVEQLVAFALAGLARSRPRGT